MAKVVRTTLREQVTSELRIKILTGKLAPGTRIVENELAEEFGVSRAPVREALRQIEQEGLIEYTSHIGCTVRDYTEQDVYEVYLLRGTLEVLSVAICQGRFTSETIEKLDGILKNMKSVKSIEQFEETINNDNMFHECIIRECHMNRIYDQWKSLNSQNTIAFYRGIGKEEYDIHIQYKIHKEIVDAIKKGNPDEISNVLINHYLYTSKNYIDENNIPFKKYLHGTNFKI